MKKIMKVCLSLFVLFTIVNLPIKANTDLGGIMTSITIEDTNGKFNTEESIMIDFVFDKNVYLDGIEMCYTMNGETFQDIFWEDIRNNAFSAQWSIWDGYKYKKDSIEIDYFIVQYREQEDGAVITNTYSPYTEQELKDKGYSWFGNNTTFYDYDVHTFSIVNADIDTTAPVLNDYTITQNGNDVKIDFDLVETQSGIMNFYFDFYNSATDSYLNISTWNDKDYNEGRDGSIEANLNVMRVYNNYPEGVYELYGICAWDGADNRLEIRGSDLKNYTITVDANDNFLNNLDVDDIVYTHTIGFEKDEPIYFRQHTGFTYSNCLNVMAKDGDRLIQLGDISVDTSEVDLSVPGLVYVTKPFNLEIDQNTTQTININVPVEVVSVIGEIVSYKKGFEVCITYEEYQNIDVFGGEITDFMKNYAYAKLANGEIVPIDVYCGGAGGFEGIDEEGYYTYLSGCMMIYNPKYTVKDEDPVGPYLNTTFIFHLIDENNNLVNPRGDIMIPYNERPKTTYPTYNENVHITGLRGTLPSYTEVQATEVKDLDNLLGNNYVAYDIKLETSYGNIQPAANESVDVTIAVGDALKNQDVDVFYIDENGEKHLVTTTTATDSVSFETDHFSTYAIVAKNSVPEAGDTTDKTPETDDDTTNKSPDTGDHTNVAGLVAMLMASAYILLRRKNA